VSAAAIPKRLRMAPKLKRQLVVSFSLLYFFGVLYWLSRLFLQRAGEFGAEPHWLEKIAGPVHVSFALLFIFVMGMIWPQHVQPALRTKRSRISGWVFLAWMAALALTGVGVIYGTEQITNVLAWLHPWCGALLLPLLLAHWYGRSLARQKSKFRLRDG
jgi:hypothetical protein